MYRLIYSEFQYSFCSYSTKRRIIRFDNSSFVSIQLLFLFNHSATSRKVTSRFVSIQLLFLFNLHVRHEGQYGQKFQYSFCSYSTENQRTFKPDWPVSIQLLFLFNSSLCFRFLLLLVSIQLLFLFNGKRIKLRVSGTTFQYSFCSYSTSPSYERSVHFFLFQYSFCSYSTGKILYLIIVRNSFNTASVLIQQVKNLDWFYKRKFQYSFCSYSTQYQTQTTWKKRVSIQLLFLFNTIPFPKKSRKSIVSIQLLFLFN